MSATVPRSVKVRVAGRSMLPTFHADDTALIEPVTVDDLRIGDIVFYRHGDSGYLHRYLATQGDFILTKGDAHLWFDQPVASADVIGRVTKAHRDSKLIYAINKHGLWHRAIGIGHLMIGRLYSWLRTVKRWFISVLLLTLMLGIAAGVSASVTLIDFLAEAGEQEIFLYWETASETGNLGFYLERSENIYTGYEQLPIGSSDTFIPSEDEGAGWSYEYMDDQIQLETMYYYRLQDVPSDGNPGGYTDPIAAGIFVKTPIPTLPPTAIATPIPSSTPTPIPGVLFWVDPETVAAGDCATVQWQVSNVQSVYFNGSPVGGIGAQAFCPCEDQTYTLTVYFRDGSASERQIVLNVTGSCTDSPSVIPTATRAPLTLTPRPTSTTDIDVNTTQTRMIPPTPALSPTARNSGSPVNGGSDSPLATATISRQPLTPVTPNSGDDVDDTIDRIVIDTPDRQSSGINPVLWTGFVIIAGAVFIGGGIWLWRQNR